jgi:hypothetical protein
MPSLATTTFINGTDDAEEVISNLMEITVHAEGKIIPISLTTDKCTSTSWGTLCKEVVQKSLLVQESDLMLQILTKLSPNNELFSHYLIRYGDGHASVFRVAWSTQLSGSIRAKVVSGYAEANMILKPRGEGARALHHDLVKPHLLVQPLGVEYLPASVEMDLCINLVSTIQQPFPYDEDQVSVIFLREHKSIHGCLASFKVVPGDGKNDVLPEPPTAIVTECISIIDNTVAAEKKRKTPSTAKTTSTQSKNSKKDDGAQKSSAEDWNRGAAATTIATGLKSPPKKLDADIAKDMIRLHKDTISKSSKKEANSAKNPSAENGKGGDAATTTVTTELKSRPKTPDAHMVQDMIRLYKESKANESSSNVDLKTPSEGDKSAKIQDMIRLYKESKANESSSNVGLKTPTEEEKSAKKTPPQKADSETATASKKKRKVPTNVGSSGASKSPSEKKHKTSNEDNSTPSKVSLDVAENYSVTKKDGLTKKRPCGKCCGCLEKSCGNCTACTSTPKKRSEKRPCSNPKMTTMAEYEAWKLYAEMAKNGDTPPKVAAAASGKRGPKPKQFSDILSHPADDLPDGWTEKLIPRLGGDRSIRDAGTLPVKDLISDR